jgi:hypothetical protein
LPPPPSLQACDGLQCHALVSPPAPCSDCRSTAPTISKKKKNCAKGQGCGSGSGLDPDSVTLWNRIRIRIGNPDPDPGARKLRNFSGKTHF